MSRSAALVRTLILGALAAMLLVSLGSSLSSRAGHADSPIAATAEQVEPIAVGEAAPRFLVETIEGEPYDFDPSKLERPTIIISFRGGWCPYCNMHLSELRHAIPEIRDLGIDVLFLSGDRPDALYEGLKADTRDAITELDYRILSDADTYAAVALGIAFKADPSYVQRLVDGGKDIEDSSIRRRGVLPVPAVFAIDSNGIIVYSYVNPDYRVRLPADELLNVARTLVDG